MLQILQVPSAPPHQTRVVHETSKGGGGGPGPTLRWPAIWSQDTSGSRNLWRGSEDGLVPREGAKGDALAAGCKPTRPIAQEPVPSPCIGSRASERIWLRADSTPGRRLEDKRGYKLFEVHQHGEVLLYFRFLRFTP
ncbi:uncharacterized protein LOC117710560 [Arvicanthis niloticus]|uniref:uncharacterized protein LOC117710560 n=1 Tax=Arvicanthis niloticus TaxID=61156 RepID=UPI00402B70FE